MMILTIYIEWVRQKRQSIVILLCSASTIHKDG